jgi:UrcA family protein
MSARKLSAFAALALSVLAASAAPASAQARDDESVVVRFADIDLARPSGLAKLDARLRFAANRVCSSGARDASSLRVDAECRAKALAGARSELGALRSRGIGRTEVALRR